MKRYLLSALLLMGTTGVYADSYKHNLQVFTANTMEIACEGEPKELFFGEYEKVAEESSAEIKNMVNNGISQAGSNVGSWVTANGLSGSDFARNFGVGFIGTYLGTKLRGAIYSSLDDPEYLLISECNSGKEYTRLITMVVSTEELKLEDAKALAKSDQTLMSTKVNK